MKFRPTPSDALRGLLLVFCLAAILVFSAASCVSEKNVDSNNSQKFLDEEWQDAINTGTAQHEPDSKIAATSSSLKLNFDCPWDDRLENEDDALPITWVDLPPGSFKMGCSYGDVYCHTSEKPRHPVMIPSFEMTQTEITQHQFESVMGYNPTNFCQCDDCGVDGISYQMAYDFCRAVGARLPTEAEWEYAARAGTTTRFYCGDDFSCLENIAWFENNSSSAPAVVGLLEPNNFGLFDMLGNLHEYVSDYYLDNYYSESPYFDPQGPPEGSAHSLRGAGFESPEVGLRVSYRHELDPSPYPVDGVRCARNIE